MESLRMIKNLKVEESFTLSDMADRHLKGTDYLISKAIEGLSGDTAKGEVTRLVSKSIELFHKDVFKKLGEQKHKEYLDTFIPKHDEKFRNLEKKFFEKIDSQQIELHFPLGQEKV